ncbi:MAG: zonular occludens toxin [Colwellia sp.]|nr:zonular occludens toxin [Colwellia sp.]
MATKVFHGPPGSYKSSTAMWFEILPALREGRVVVTNLQGICTIEHMQSELKEVFPESARLLRISIGNDEGMLLMRNFFHWLPIGALIFIDEIQDVFPNDKSFKMADYDYVSEGRFDDLLPEDFKELYHREQRQIKNNINVDDYQDDLGNSLFDERDYLRYPRTLRECFMRHRHYNWDILLATPDIKEISAFVRSVCEVAYCHSSKDAIPIPYYKRRPRILEHTPKTNGLSAGKNDIVYFKKVPLDVFKLYKSTATGKNTKSGAGQSPFTPKLLAGFAFILLYIFYMVFFFFGDDDDKVSASPDNAKTTQIQHNSKVSKTGKEDASQVIKNGFKSTLTLDDVSFRHADVSSIITANNFVNLPFSASSMYISGMSTVRYSKHMVSRDFVFTVYRGEDVFSMSSDSLIDMGYKVFYKANCLVELRSDIGSNYLYCEPNKVNDDTESDKSSFEVSLL